MPKKKEKEKEKITQANAALANAALANAALANAALVLPIKRKLTVDEMHDICQTIPLNMNLPPRVAESIVQRIRAKLRKDLEHVSIYPEKLEAFKKEILKYYNLTLIQAGEAVGVITAQSIGERQTQTTLNSFHSAGLTIKTVVTGVPRFSELLNATKDPKMVNCLIFLNERFSDLGDIRKRIDNSITEITLKRLVKTTELMKGPLEPWHILFCKIYRINCSHLGWRLRFILNTDILYEYKIRMRMIKTQIEKMYPNMTVLYTPESEGLIDVCINEFENEEEPAEETEDIEEDKEDAKEKENEKENEEEEMNEEEMNEEETNEEETREITIIEPENIKPLDLPVDEYPVHPDIEQMIMIEDKMVPQLLSIQISGISKIREIFFEKRKADVKEDPEEWVITTEGSNLYGLFADPLVDKKRTLSNNMWEIYTVFGIEATRQFLIEEFMDVVSSDGTFVNSSHVELLVDLMVYTGSIISISRYGQKKVGSGPMSKASFEESLENFLKAALNGETETTDSVSASIMLGKLPKIGTGIFDLKVDMAAVAVAPPPIFKEESVVEKEIDQEAPPLLPQPPVISKKFKKINSLF